MVGLGRGEPEVSYAEATRFVVPSFGSYMILALPVLSLSTSSSIRSSSESSESKPPRVAYSSNTPRNASWDNSRKGISNMLAQVQHLEIAACIPGHAIDYPLGPPSPRTPRLLKVILFRALIFGG